MNLSRRIFLVAFLVMSPLASLSAASAVDETVSSITLIMPTPRQYWVWAGIFARV